MLLEKHIHRQARIWPLGISENACMPTRPGMPHTIDEPVFLNLVSGGVIPAIHGIRMTTRNLSIRCTAGMVEIGVIGTMGREKIGFHPLPHNLGSVDRRSHKIARPVKNDSGDDTSKTTHGGKSG